MPSKVPSLIPLKKYWQCSGLHMVAALNATLLQIAAALHKQETEEGKEGQKCIVAMQLGWPSCQTLGCNGPRE
jgi:hypothetical protein